LLAQARSKEPVAGVCPSTHYTTLTVILAQRMPGTIIFRIVYHGLLDILEPQMTHVLNF